jgi:hypothetical protein
MVVEWKEGYKPLFLGSSVPTEDARELARVAMRPLRRLGSAGGAADFRGGIVFWVCRLVLMKNSEVNFTFLDDVRGKEGGVVLSSSSSFFRLGPRVNGPLGVADASEPCPTLYDARLLGLHLPLHFFQVLLHPQYVIDKGT